MLNRVEELPEYAATSESREDSGLSSAINFAWRQWKLIGGVTLVALAIGALNLSRTIPLYTASAQLMLNPTKEKAAGQDVILADTTLDMPMIESQILLLRSSGLLRRVVDREHLVNDSEFGSQPISDTGPGMLSSIRAFFTRGKAGAQKEISPEAGASASLEESQSERAATIENLKGAVAVKRTGQAYALDVSVTSADPAKAARLANAVADAYVVDKLDARFEAAKRASAWLSDRLVELRQQLRESEEAVAKFRSENNLPASGGASGATLNQEQIGQLNARLVTARSETAEKKARLEILQKVEARGGGVAALPDTLNSGAFADLRKQANDISRQEADLLAKYNPNHPAVVNLRAQAADVNRSIRTEVAHLAANVRNEYELAKARQDAVEKTLREVTGQTDLDSSKVITLRELERNATVNKSLFEDFLQRARVTQEQSTFEARDARVITTALAPGFPSSPKKTQVMMISMVLGLMAGVGLAYAREILNAGFTTPRQLEEQLGLPLLASISKMEARELAVDGKPLTLAEYPIAKPLSRLSEAFRTLRSAVQMSDVDNPPKTLLVTSTVPGEGKSTLALAIAGSASQSGARVLVIDADLRHNSVTRYFKAAKRAGLVDYLMGTATLDAAIAHDDRLNLWFLAGGAKTQNPPDLLGSERMKALIEELGREYDLVIVDAPPLGPVVDPVILAQLVDKVIFVVRWASTAREMVAHSVERLSGHKKVAGVVFNMVIDAQAQKYGKYAYSYYYGGRYYKKYYSE